MELTIQSFKHAYPLPIRWGTTISIGVWMSLPDKTGLHVLIDQKEYYEAAPVVQT